MTGTLLIVQATLLAVVSGFSVIHTPYFQHQPFGFQQPVGFQQQLGFQQPFGFQQPVGFQRPFGYQQPLVNGWKQLDLRSTDQNLPCPGPGFFVHPQNCSQFYRCVDYAGTGYLFSRYLFECPSNHAFVTALQTCLPGSCEGLPAQPVIVPSTPAPATTASSQTTVPTVIVPSTPAPTTTASSQTTVPPVTTSAPTTPTPTEDTGITTWSSVTQYTSSATAASTEVQTESSTSEVSTESPIPEETPTEASTTVSTVSEDPAVQECPTTYVQHAEYCNIYHPCKEPAVRYACPGGTAFDQPRQMCRIIAQDDTLCIGKAVFQHPILLRTENIGAHVLLPDDFLLPTAHAVQNPFQQTPESSVPFAWPPVASPEMTFGLPAASPEQLFLQPTARPVNFQNNQENQGSVNLRPVLSRPFQPTFNNARPLLNSAAPFLSEKQSSVEQVRRPLVHLHFPQHLLPEIFGYHRDLTLD